MARFLNLFIFIASDDAKSLADYFKEQEKKNRFKAPRRLSTGPISENADDYTFKEVLVKIPATGAVSQLRSRVDVRRLKWIVLTILSLFAEINQSCIYTIG